MPELTNHLKKLKEVYNQLNPTADKKEVPYLVNLRKVITQLEQLLGDVDTTDGSIF